MPVPTFLNHVPHGGDGRLRRRFVATAEELVSLQPYRRAGSHDFGDASFGSYLNPGPHGKPFRFDFWTMVDLEIIHSRIMQLMGEKGKGKSAFAILMMLRFSTLTLDGSQYKIAANSTKVSQGNPEFKKLADFFGATQFKVRGSQINPLDYYAGMRLDDMIDMAVTISASQGHPFSPLALNIVAVILDSMVERAKSRIRNTSVNELMMQAEKITAKDISDFRNRKHYAELQKIHNLPKVDTRITDEEVVQAANSVVTLFSNLLTRYDGTFGGDGTLREVFDSPFVSFDFTGFRSTDERFALVQAVLWRLQAAEQSGFKLIVNDENYELLDSPAYVKELIVFLKKNRGSETAVVNIAHRLSDYTDVTLPDGSTTDNPAKIIDEADIFVVFKLKKLAAEQFCERADLSNRMMRDIMRLKRGEAYFIIPGEVCIKFKAELFGDEKELTRTERKDRSTAPSRRM